MVTATDPRSSLEPPRVAVIGAGPVGLALALLVLQRLPRWQVSVFDRRPREHDVRGDPRTLALSLGSVQLLERLGCWPAAEAQPILEVHVSQAVSLPGGAAFGAASGTVTLSAGQQRVPMLGAVVAYGALLAPLQQAFLARCAAAAVLSPGDDARSGPRERFGCAVTAVDENADDGAVLTLADGTREAFDVAVVAEGGVFAEQPRQSIARDYGQTAWVGSVELEGARAGRAIERFTPDGPLALLPLRAGTALAPGRLAAALVWCVPSADDPVAPLSDAQRLVVLNSRLPADAGRVVSVSPLKSFALGLNAEGRAAGTRALRIGNAAQTLHPVAGQGLNLGLRDAWRWVDCCVGAGPRPDDAALERALRSFGPARAPDRWRTILATDFLARSFTWPGPVPAAARGLGLALVQALPPLKAALAHQMMFGWR